MREAFLPSVRIVVATLALSASVVQQLGAQHRTVITGTVRSAATHTPIASARVQATSGESYVTGRDGTYRMIASSDKIDLRVTALGFAPASKSAVLMQGTANVIGFELDRSAVQLDEVVMTGTRARGRTVTSSAVPIDVISRDAMEKTAAVEPWQQLQRLVPSVNVPHIPIADNAARPITLRGLAPHHALVLVNGKRRHPASALLAGPSVPSTAFTDMNAIPASAIDHIEILRDGASAQYGSDAIGGVLNVILKSGEYRDLRVSTGQVFSSDGGRTLHDGRLADVDGTFGMLGEDGARFTVSAELRHRGGSNRAYPDQRPQYFANDPRNNDVPRISSYIGDGELNDLNLFVSAATPISATAEAYAFAGAAHRNDVTPDAFFRRPLDVRTVRAIFPNGFLPEIESGIRDVSVFGGIRGSKAGWRWDVSSGVGGNRVAYQVTNSNNVSLGVASPTSFYAGRLGAQQWTNNVDLTRDLHLASVPITLSGGAELRIERYQIHAGDDASWRDGGVRIPDGPQTGQLAQVGSQGMPGFRPTDEVRARRSNTAAYLEAEGRPVERMLIQSAVRAEHYSDFGSTTDGKIAARFEFVHGIAARGSISTGFRAPALTQEYLSRTNTVFSLVNGVNTVRLTRTFPVNTDEAKLMGATSLRPETSVNRSFGVVLNRPHFPQVTADYYQIDIDDRIQLAGVVTDTSLVRLFEEKGLRGINGGNYFRNATDTRTRGVDVVAAYSFLLANSGLVQILGGYNHNRTRVTRVAPPPPPLAKFSSAIFNRSSRGVIENGQPRQTVTIGIDYTARRFGLNLQNQRAGPTAQLDQANAAADQFVQPKWITDIRASYQVRTRLQLALSVANLFDVYPTEWNDFKNGVNATGVSMAGIYRYPAGLSAFGMNGRTLYAQLSYR